MNLVDAIEEVKQVRLQDEADYVRSKKVMELSSDIEKFINSYMQSKIAYVDLGWIIEAWVIKNCKLD